MKEETPEGRAALVRLESFKDLVEGDRKILAWHEKQLTEELVRYAVSRPLTEAERTEIAEYVAVGGTLCCVIGLAWLRARLPEPWAQAINGWAYEHLGCNRSEEERRADVEKAMDGKIVARGAYVGRAKPAQ